MIIISFGVDHALLFHFFVKGVNTVTLVIDFLDPYTLYTFRVLAYHSAGNGVSSNYVDARTMEGSKSVFDWLNLL